MAYRYSAFLSYSHAVDAKLAPAVQSALHQLGRPWYRLRSVWIYRDKSSLAATPSLWRSIEQALEQSENLILLASPESAASFWVQKEVAWWLAHRDPENLFVVVTGGDLGWRENDNDFDWQITDALPQLLQKRFVEEPLWVDLRWARVEERLSLRHSRFRLAILDLAAPLLKRPKEMIDGDDIKVYRRNRQAASLAVAISLSLALFAGYSAIRANQQAKRAVAGENLARVNAATAEREARRAVVGERLARENAEHANRETQRAIAGEAQAKENALRARARELTSYAAKLQTEDPALALFVGLRVLRMGDPLPHGLEEILAHAEDSGPTYRVIRNQEEDVHVIACSPVENLLAIGTDAGTISVLDTTNGRRTATLIAPRNVLGSLAWNPSGQILAAGGSDKIIRLWDVPSGKQVGVITGHEDRILALAWGPRGRVLASASADGSIRLWDPLTGQSQRKLQGPPMSNTADDKAGAMMVTLMAQIRPGQPNPVHLIAWNHEGTILAAGGTDRTVRLWDATRGLTLREYRSKTNIVNLFWTDDDSLRSIDSTGIVTEWDWVKDVRRDHHLDQSSVVQAQWSPDGKSVLTVGSAGIRVSNVESGQTRQTLRSGSPPVLAMGWSSDGRTVVTGSHDRAIRFWDVDNGQALRIIDGHDRSPTGSKYIWGVAWSPDSQRIASAADDRTIRIWERATGRMLRVLRGHTELVSDVVWNSGGTLLASASWDETVGVWDDRTGRMLHSFEASQNAGDSLAWNRDGSVLAYVSADHNTIGLWNADGGGNPRMLQTGQVTVESLCWSPDGKRLASTAYDGSLKIWRLPDGKMLRALPTNGALRTAMWSPDGTILASGGDDSVIRLWDPARGQLLRRLQGHQAGVISLSWSPNGQTLASAGYDRTIRLWRTSNGELLRVLEGHHDSIGKIAWSPDGQTIASASHDGTIRLWPGTFDLLVKRVQHSIRSFAPDETDCKSYLDSVGCSPAR